MQQQWNMIECDDNGAAVSDGRPLLLNLPSVTSGNCGMAENSNPAAGGASMAEDYAVASPKMTDQMSEKMRETADFLMTEARDNYKKYRGDPLSYYAVSSCLINKLARLLMPANESRRFYIEDAEDADGLSKIVYLESQWSECDEAKHQGSSPGRGGAAEVRESWPVCRFVGMQWSDYPFRDASGFNLGSTNSTMKSIPGLCCQEACAVRHRLISVLASQVDSSTNIGATSSAVGTINTNNDGERGSSVCGRKDPRNGMERNCLVRQADIALMKSSESEVPYYKLHVDIYSPTMGGNYGSEEESKVFVGSDRLALAKFLKRCYCEILIACDSVANRRLFSRWWRSSYLLPVPGYDVESETMVIYKGEEYVVIPHNHTPHPAYWVTACKTEKRNILAYGVVMEYGRYDRRDWIEICLDVINANVNNHKKPIVMKSSTTATAYGKSSSSYHPNPNPKETQTSLSKDHRHHHHHQHQHDHDHDHDHDNDGVEITLVSLKPNSTTGNFDTIYCIFGKICSQSSSNKMMVPSNLIAKHCLSSSSSSSSSDDTGKIDDLSIYGIWKANDDRINH